RCRLPPLPAPDLAAPDHHHAAGKHTVRSNMNIRSITCSSAAALTAVLLLGACSGQPPKADDSLVRAKTAIDQATLAGAGQYAPTDLNDAQSQLQAADAAQA